MASNGTASTISQETAKHCVELSFYCWLWGDLNSLPVALLQSPEPWAIHFRPFTVDSLSNFRSCHLFVVCMVLSTGTDLSVLAAAPLRSPEPWQGAPEEVEVDSPLH